MTSMDWLNILAEGELAAAIHRQPDILFGGSVPDGVKTIHDVLQWYSHQYHVTGMAAVQDIARIYKVPFPSAT